MNTILKDDKTESFVYHIPSFLTPEDSDKLFSFCEQLSFEREMPVVNGVRYPSNRFSCAFSEAPKTYSYAGISRKGNPMPSEFYDLIRKIHLIKNDPYNFVLCNLYPNGKAGLGFHSDDEPDLYFASTIASISLGETRTFVIKKKYLTQNEVSVHLKHGDLLLMCGQTQQNYLHSLIKNPLLQGKRINLTLRNMR